MGGPSVVDRYRPPPWRLCGWPTRSGQPCRVPVSDRPGNTCAMHAAAAADAAASRQRAIDYVRETVLVNGRRREILLCECGAAMIAGFDHTCDPGDRRGGAAG